MVRAYVDGGGGITLRAGRGELFCQTSRIRERGKSSGGFPRVYPHDYVHGIFEEKTSLLYTREYLQMVTVGHGHSIPEESTARYRTLGRNMISDEEENGPMKWGKSGLAKGGMG
ncbi:hypothetical protein EVAR_20198_1 [Eumeta japonica]|uniref:Uncharacterized protein n=1 Tax=Eumeta variegata TaxID=151549 RepID=A0A4C1UTV3_EUMVA|nr:hypothetical protein EVAR_20198_1 [Eumeta japonica]